MSLSLEIYYPNVEEAIHYDTNIMKHITIIFLYRSETVFIEDCEFDPITTEADHKIRYDQN